MIASITRGRPLPSDLVDQIVQKTDGVPLYVEAVVHSIIDEGVVREDGDRFVLARPGSSINIPPTLENSLMSRLDMLRPKEKKIAQQGAVLGRSFSQDLIRAVVESEATDAEMAVREWRDAQECLTQLVEAGVLRRQRSRQTTFEFNHALIQDAAAKLLLKATRQAYHRQTARVLEEKFPHVVDTQPELLAHHYAEALEPERAFHYWQLAGARARDRSANREAMQHFAKALKALGAMPENEERDRFELGLRTANFTPFIAVKGYVAEETAATAERARTLGQRLGDVQRQFPAHYLIWVNRYVSARYASALEVAKEFSREAAQQEDPAPQLVSHRLRGFSRFAIGEHSAAERELHESLKMYDAERHGDLKNQYGQDVRVACEALMALVQWLRGYPDDAAKWSRISLEHATAARHSNTWAYAHCWGGTTFEVFRANAAGAEQRASELIAFAEKEGLPVWMAYGPVLHGWALVQLGRFDVGIAEMENGMTQFDDADPRSLRMGFMKSFLLALLGEAYGRTGRCADGIAKLVEASSFAQKMQEAFWQPEVERVHGELLLHDCQGSSSSNRREAEALFTKARALAAGQGAKSLELRAVMSLARLWREEEPVEAYRLLSDTYAAFTEGFDSPDLADARELLAQFQTNLKLS
jgi:predicted ATPase